MGGVVGGGGAGWWLRGAGCVFGVRALRGREGKGEVKGFVFFFREVEKGEDFTLSRR